MPRILVVVGTRPNFIKITQFRKECARFPRMILRIVHTGQHHDDKMAAVFFQQFGLQPDHFLNIPAGSPNSQIARISLSLEELIQKQFTPDLIIVPGDVNSTLAGAVTANKMGIKLAHLESGLRSFDRTMPEEFNRILTDVMSDFLFVTEQSGIDNLMKEGRDKSSLFMVGNTMIDTLVAYKEQIESSPVLEKMELSPQKYVLMTMHRPATVDSVQGWEKLLSVVESIGKKYNVVFPVHPRSLKNADSMGLSGRMKNMKFLKLADPLDYFSFQKLVKYSKFIITDSGGIQEESTFLKVPCLTLRPNTERPVTLEGTNELVPFEIQHIKMKVEQIEDGSFKKGVVPFLWDGKATARVVDVISQLI